MASQRTSVSTPVSWLVAADDTRKLFLPASGAANNLSAPEAYNHAATLWNSVLATSSGQSAAQSLVIPVPPDLASVIIMKFVVEPNSATAGGPGTMYLGIGALWGVAALVDDRVEPAATEYVGEHLGQFDLTANDTDIGSSTLLPTGGPAFARRTTVRVDRASLPGLRVVGERGEASPVLVAGAMGYTHVIVELRCKLPANVDGVFYPVSPIPATDAAPTGLGVLYRFA